MRTQWAAVALLLLASACAERNVELENEFRAECSTMTTRLVGDSNILVEAREGWLFVKGELSYLAAGSYVGENAPHANPKAPPDRANPVPAIVDFSRRLEERNIDLYIVPIPVRPAIYPESVLGSERFTHPDGVPNLDGALRELISVLRKENVRVIDLAPLFLMHRSNPEQRAIFCPSDAHWTPFGISLAAQALASEIRDRPWYESIPKQKFRHHWRDREHSGNLYSLLKDETGRIREPDVVQARKITKKTGDRPRIVPMQNPGSPVVIIGDSNAVWWKWQRFSSSLPQQLAFELGFPVDVLSTKGGGANETRLNLARRLRAEPEYLQGKRAVIWVFSARSFTNEDQGWILIPI